MKIAGMSACVPKNTVETTLAYEHFKKFDVDRIIGNTGVLQKREAEEGVTATDLCIAAAKPLLEALGWAPDSVDALVLMTTLPDYIMPASAHRAQQELGLGHRCLVFDMTLGCSGFTHGMIVLDGLIKAGVVKRALLLCGEMTSDRFRPRLEKTVHRTDLANALLFGDAGSATALTDEGDQVRSVVFGADGSGVEQIIVPGGLGKSYWSPALFERVADEEGDERRPIDLVLRGPQILTFTMKRVPPMLAELCEGAGWTKDDIDVYALHQANKFMLTFLARKMKIDASKVPFSIEKFGNTSSASIPLTMITQCGERMRQPTKWAMMGFGVGLSWSGLMMETDEIFSLPLHEV
ncbi:MAG: ketoacyl-ACP synthase III [Myxococcales bacterium]|nr:ketoacyl-ACP synthase III [Myxococcales bacterium]